MNGCIKRLLTFGGLGLVAVWSSQLFASGYRLEFQSASVLADSGDAAVVEDAGTNWYNSAGLVYLPKQAAISAIDLYEKTAFKGTASTPGIFGGDFITQTGQATSYVLVGVPAIHYAIPFNDCYAFGLSIVPAWGLLEDYGPQSLLRYDLERIYTKTINIAPSIAWKIDNHWSIGAGPDIHYWYLTSKTRVRTQPVTGPDSISRFSTDDWGYGGHIGVLYRYDDKTRVGLNYRSKVFMTQTGYSDFAFEDGRGFESNTFQVNIPLPPTTSLSVYHEMTPCWALMGTITYDQWSVIRNLHGQDFIGPTGMLSSVNVPQDFNNTFDFSFGTHYKLTENLLLRASIKYEQTPTNDQHRDVNFPDGEKLGFNFGSRYQISKCLAVDLIYAHVFTRTVPINITNVFGANVNGRSDVAIDLAGAQLVWNI